MPQRFTGLKAVSNYKRGVKGKGEKENLNAQPHPEKLIFIGDFIDNVENFYVKFVDFVFV